MTVSNYARKQMIRGLSNHFTQPQWELLSKDAEFVQCLLGPNFDLEKAKIRAALLLKPTPAFNPPKFVSKTRELVNT